MTTATRPAASTTPAETSAAKVTVNAAFLQEIKEVNEELWDLLQEIEFLCAHPNSVRGHARHLVGMLGQLRDQLAMHFALEEYYGYFEEPVRVSPSLAKQARSMLAEHGDLYLHISRIADHAERFWFRRQIERLVDYIPLRFNAFHDQLKRHESREDDLILNVFADNQELFEILQLSDDVDVVDWAVRSLPRYRLDDDFHRRVLHDIERVMGRHN
jgi:hypothetical protein